MRERRRYFRIPFTASLKAKAVEKVKIFGNLGKDLSIKGVRFVSTNFLPVKSLVRLETRIGNDLRGIKFIVRVEWIKCLYDNELFEAGARIVSIAREDEQKLKEFIDAGKLK